MKLDRLSVKNVYKNSIYYTKIIDKEHMLDLIIEMQTCLLIDKGLSANFLITSVSLANFIIKPFTIEEPVDLHFNEITNNICKLGKINGINIFIDSCLPIDIFCIGYSSKIDESNIDEDVTLKLENVVYSYLVDIVII